MTTESGRTVTTVTMNPLFTIDEWAVLSDGNVAVVRGQDYHVEMLNGDGSTIVGPKLPFDWKRLTDIDKQHLIDSTRSALGKREADLKSGAISAPTVSAAPPMALAPPGGFVAIGIPPAANGAVSTFEQKTEFVPLKDIPDYWPPIRVGAARTDLNARLWILPTTSAASKNGELVYDVVDSRGVLTERVRVPAGKSIAGFGRGDVVYLMVRDPDGWTIERTHLVQ
jgi:hypothetical protein